MASKSSSGERSTVTVALQAMLDLQHEVQEVVVRYTESKRIRTTVHEDLMSLGLPYEVTTEGDHIQVPEIEVPTQVNGTDRTDYTDAALRRMDEAALLAFRQRVWDFFRRGIRNGSFTEEEGLGYLGELHYTLPEQATEVIAETPDGAVPFNLPGRVEKEAVREALNAQYELPVVAKVQAAFGADATGLPEPVSFITVSHIVKWDAAAEANGLKNR
jgi:hypothetical protein